MKDWLLVQKKAQTSFEFLVLLSFMLLIFGGFFVVAEDLLVKNNQRNIEQSLIATANVVRDEILVANQVPAGYSRNFNLPPMVAEQEYEISIFENELVVSTQDDIVFEYIFFLPFSVGDVDGDLERINLTKGPAGNTIRHVTNSGNDPAVRIEPQ